MYPEGHHGPSDALFALRQEVDPPTEYGCLGVGAVEWC
jgi:hypothetical protein